MPKIIGPVTADKWEREVRRQFSAQLPHDWTVVCSVAWSTRDAGGYVRDGQSDFVVLVPDHGMVIAEVKGSRGVRVGEDGNWYRKAYSAQGIPAKEEVRIEEPHTDQATRNMHELEAIVRQALGWEAFRGAYAYVVIYPNGEVSSPPALLDPTTIICKRHIHDLERRLLSSLVARGSARAREKFSASNSAGVASVLAKYGFTVRAVDTELEAEEDDSMIDRLTRQQFAALKGAFELPRVAILGPAGSGKTLLAIWKLKALIEEGKRAVYVCFNKALAEFLRIQNPECAEAIIHVDSLFHGITGPQGIRGDPNYFFSEQLPQQVLDLALTLDSKEKYEAILVDEGQDFGDSRTIALFELLRDENSQWIFFADWNQNVYQKQSDTPLGAEVVFHLYHNCRNTESVTVATNRYCEMDVAPMPGSPTGEHPLVECRSSTDSMAMRAWDIIHELQPQGGAVILSPYKLQNSCMAGKVRGHGLELTQDSSKLGASGYVFFSTIRSFKGLEAGVVVLVQAEKPGLQPTLSLEDLYVACTRSRSRLAIITGSESSKMWFMGLLC
jgi:hypothetical protein